MIPIVVFISGNGTNLQAIIDQCHGKTVDIVGVISDQETAYGLKRAQNANIPRFTMVQYNDETREDYCHRLRTLMLGLLKPKLIVLAGFMKILTPNFVNTFPKQIINIHPSLLPKHPGLNTHEKVLEEGDKEHGITIHLVNNELDAGPILMQRSISVIRSDTPSSLKDLIHTLEHEWYPEVINLLARWINISED